MHMPDPEHVFSLHPTAWIALQAVTHKTVIQTEKRTINS